MKPIDIPKELLPMQPGRGLIADDDDGADQHRKMKVRTVFISDIHLGTRGCQAHILLDFLKHCQADTYYLVGDIVDGWRLKRSWYWPQAHNDVVQKLLRKARKGKRIVFVPGNHDEFARQYEGLAFGDIEVHNEAIHTTADGKRLLVLHGDKYDNVVRFSKWLALVGDVAYEAMLKLNRPLNHLRAWFGLSQWSLSSYLKLKVKSAVSYISCFEEIVAKDARDKGVDGVVCGHIHHAEIREINGFIYCNDGDWVESCTALVEHFDGRLEILRWLDVFAEAHAKPKRLIAKAVVEG